MNWWQYLLLVNVYLVLFYGFYALLLSRETFFQLNRLYLVSAALLSFFIPLIQSNWVQNLFITQTVHYTIYGSPVTIYQLKPVESVPLSMGQLLSGLYLAGVVFLLLRFIWQLISLKRIINRAEQSAPYSFFKKIKVDKQTADSEIIAVHEQVHAKQWHSADVLIIEAVMIINWLNPVVYFYRYAIKHIHEFIADSHTLANGTDKADYAMLLLTETFNTPQHRLVSNFFNKSLLKQRIIMLQKNKSQRAALIKYGLSAPLFILMLILSSATVNNSSTIRIINKKAGQIFTIPAGQITSVNIIPADTALKLKLLSTNKNINHAIAGEIAVERFKEIEKAKALKTDTVPANNSQVFNAVETEPNYPGGLNNFYNFLAREIRYPAIDKENKVKGEVFLTFIVEKDGSLSNIKALRGPSQTLIDEAIRAVSLSPKWEPGIQKGEAVRVQYTMPISFALAIDTTLTTNNNRLTMARISGMHQSLDEVRINSTYYVKADSGKKNISVVLMPPAPLYIVNGKQMASGFNLNTIDAKTIESISILKDKSSKEIYGAKGANGVIIITTKKK